MSVQPNDLNNKTRLRCPIRSLLVVPPHFLIWNSKRPEHNSTGSLNSDCKSKRLFNNMPHQTSLHKQSIV
eukprot:5348923-Amphidinium_carterae.1